MGAPEGMGLFLEKCAGCGDSIIHLTAGICPIARCAKSLLNGPAGKPERYMRGVEGYPLRWDQIVKALERQGGWTCSDRNSPKDWRPSRNGGPRRIVNQEDLPGSAQKGWRGEQ
jgi:hypothetical protein